MNPTIVLVFQRQVQRVNEQRLNDQTTDLAESHRANGVADSSARTLRVLDTRCACCDAGHVGSDGSKSFCDKEALPKAWHVEPIRTNAPAYS